MSGDDLLILVDENDDLIGFETKLKAHEDGGKLHRAFSVFVFDAEGRLLLQRRARSKYHFGGLWTNTCCSHPRKGEDLEDAVHRRLQEEFGFDTGVEKLFSFIYRAPDEASGLTEHEYDHVFHGRFDGEPQPNPDEIEGWGWADPAELAVDVEKNPRDYTPWFRISLREVIQALPNRNAASAERGGVAAENVGPTSL